MKRLSIIVLATYLSSGCAAWKTLNNDPFAESPQATQASQETNISPSRQLIATDFVNALQQLDEVEPSTTTVHLSNDRNEDVFVQALRESLVLAGYGIRWVEDGSREHFLQYRLETQASDRRTRREVYELAVGDIEMRRTYDTDIHDTVKPTTPMFVRGADASGIVLNDEIFTNQTESPKLLVTESEQAGNEQASVSTSTADSDGSGVFSPENDLAAWPNGIQTGDASSGNSTDSISPLGSIVSGSGVKPLTLPLISLPKVENVFDLGGSNFQDVLTGYEIVSEQILMFPNDSLRLGNVNKQFIDRMVQQFDQESDVFSVVGCSMGPTAVSGGNAALALGRASRVVEALMFAGVEKDRILDEGCWASDSETNTLPTRGVVVTLNRNKS